MLDVLMMQHLPGSIFSDRSFRCHGCGQGPVMAGDGFMMNRCLNCGRYQHATELGGFDFTWVHARVMRPWRRLKLSLECRSNRDGNGLGQLKATCEESGGVK